MAFRLDYVARETGQNLIRNWLLATATVVVVAVSLTSLGSMFLARTAIENAFVKWNNDVSFIVYMNASATKDQIDSVGKELDGNPQVDSVDYFDQTESYELFKKIFEKDDPDLVGTLKPEDLPTSYRVKPRNPNADVVQALANAFKPKPGVFKVEFPNDQIRKIQRGAERITTVLLGASTVLIAAASVLIFIAIQTAVFSRRREIEVMRLVGATNWYIRTPFLIEGLVQGFGGALVAGGFLSLATVLVTGKDGWFEGSILEKFTWNWADLTGGFTSGFPFYSPGTLFWMGLIGICVGMGSSFVATAWYLRD